MVGVIVDIMDREDRRVMKASWVQAKRAEAMPNTLQDLQDVVVQVVQVGRMQSRTKEAYLLLYTPEGIRVFRGTDMNQELIFDHLIVEMLRCPAGDRDRDLIIDPELPLGSRTCPSQTRPDFKSS